MLEEAEDVQKSNCRFDAHHSHCFSQRVPADPSSANVRSNMEGKQGFLSQSILLIMGKKGFILTTAICFQQLNRVALNCSLPRPCREPKYLFMS